MQAERSVRRHLCLWLPDPLPPDEAERGERLKATHRRERERKRLEAFALWCQQFSPCVSIEREPGERGIAGSTLLLEITGLGPLFGGEQGLVKTLSRALCRRHVRAHLGLADSIGTAWALAHFGRYSILDDSPPFRAPAIAIHQLAPGTPPLKTLAPLPVAALRLLPVAIESLALLGIHTVGQLLVLPRKQLASRFGKEVAQSIDRVTGNLAEALPILPPPEETSAEWSFEFPTCDCDLVNEVFRQLVDRIGHTLSDRSRIPLGIACRLKLQDRTEVHFAVALYRACGDVPHLAELLGLRLERTPLTAPVCDVTLTVTESAQREYRQLTWFDHHEGDHSTDSLPTNPFAASLERCLERLHGRLGSRAVVQPQLRTDAIAERAVRFVSAARRSRRNRTPAIRKTFHSIDLRPLWLHRHPQRIEIARCDRNDLPLEFYCLGGRHTVRLIEGPERIESSRHAGHRARRVFRDYYRVETTSLKRFWIFRTARDWFLHGQFD